MIPYNPERIYAMQKEANGRKVFSGVGVTLSASHIEPLFSMCRSGQSRSHRSIFSFKSPLCAELLSLSNNSLSIQPAQSQQFLTRALLNKAVRQTYV